MLYSSPFWEGEGGDRFRVALPYDDEGLTFTTQAAMEPVKAWPVRSGP